jgi:hypothetical protein
MCYTYDAFKAYVPEMVEVLIDSVRNPAFLDWEIKEQVCRHLKLTAPGLPFIVIIMSCSLTAAEDQR